LPEDGRGGKVKILCVDDEPNILEAYQRSLRKQFRIETAINGEQGLEVIAKNGPFAVIVADMRMPGMDGVQLLMKVKDQAPDTVRIMLTGNADQRTAIDAVNEGCIFRFLTKPCSPEMLAKALIAGLEQYRLITSERELLQNTLTGSVKVLTDLLSLVSPTAFSRASRVRRLASEMAARLKIPNPWQVEIAAMLSQIGCLTIPEEMLTKIYRGQSLTSEEAQMFHAHPQIGHDLIARIPRLETVATIIAYQEKRYDGTGIPRDDKCGEEIPVGARILKVALDFDRLASRRLETAEAFAAIEAKGDRYDPAVIKALKAVLAEEIKYQVKSVAIEELNPGMILARNVTSSTGMVLMAEGQEVSPYLCKRVQNLASRGAVQALVKVLVPTVLT
jgi:response regulator RpfG family c-di-GMP phosphodiesterase